MSNIPQYEEILAEERAAKQADAIEFIIDALKEIVYDLIDKSTADYETKRQLNLFMLNIVDLPQDQIAIDYFTVIRLRMIRDALGVEGNFTLKDIGEKSGQEFVITSDKSQL